MSERNSHEEARRAERDPDSAPADLLDLIRAEMGRAIGFDNDPDLSASRERALRYMKGDMAKDVPTLPQRSRAVSSDLADAVETLLPDLMEIFTGGEDVVAFTPVKPEDEQSARQETQYLTHVVFHDNPGFREFYSAIKDALLLRTGIFKFWWNEKKVADEERFEGKNAVEMLLASQDGEISDVEIVTSEGMTPPAPVIPDNAIAANSGVPAPAKAGVDPGYNFTLTRTRDLSGATYKAIPPDDFSVAPDTVDLSDTTYCVFRTRPRVQDLIADGFDPDDVRDLSPFGDEGSGIRTARDSTTTSRDDPGDLRQVEIREHYIRLLGDDGRLVLWCCVTDAAAIARLARNGETAWRVARIPFVAGAPYLVAHRFYGQSLADKLFEIQRIKTALTRAVLDSTYFGLNQRQEVAMDRANEYTLADLLRNEPGMPVRSRSGDAIRPLAAPGLGFDPYAALEYFATVAENRTGIVRNAQGLNPDTLHDTATGAMALIGAAQKRTRMIARILAETLFKPLYLGLHAEIRENASAARLARLNGSWVEVNPSTWAERNAMIIEVGLGASGREAEIATYREIATVMQTIVNGQGGAHGPIVFPQNVYAAARDLFARLSKKSNTYLSDPALAPTPPAAPDPKTMEAQGKLSLLHQENTAEAEAARIRIANDLTLGRERLAMEHQMRRYQIDQEIALKRYQIDREAQAPTRAQVHIGGEPG